MTPDELKDLILLQRQVAWQYDLDNLSTKELKRVQRSINVAKEEIVTYFRRRGDDIGEWTAERLDDAMSELDSLTVGMQGELGENIQELYANVGTQALAAQNNMLSFGNRVAGFNFVAMSAAQLKSIASDTAVGGQQLNYWVNKVFDKTMQRDLREQVMAGMLKGEGYPQFVKRLQAQFGNLSKREATTLARTYVQSANVNAQSSVYKANRDIVKQVKWSSVLEPGYSKTGRGTCIRCSALDGNTYDHDDHPLIPLHPRCRCILLPVTKTYRELGLDIDEIQQNYRPYTIRPNKNVGAGGKRRIINTGFHQGNYDTWFDKQNRTFKRNMLGPGRLKLYDEGVSYKRMVSPSTGRLYNLDEIEIFQMEGWPIGATDYAKMPNAEKEALKKLLLDKGPYPTVESLEHLNGREVKMLASGLDVPTFGRNRVAISDDIVAYYKNAGVKPPTIKPPPGPITPLPGKTVTTIEDLNAMSWPELRKFGSGLGIKGKHGRDDWNDLILKKLGADGPIKPPKVTPKIVPPAPPTTVPDYKSMSWPEVRKYAREMGIKGKHNRPDLEALIAKKLDEVDSPIPSDVQDILDDLHAGVTKPLNPEDVYLNQLQEFNDFFTGNPKLTKYQDFRKASMGWGVHAEHGTYADYAAALAQHQRVFKAELDYMKHLRKTDYDKWKNVRKEKLEGMMKKNLANNADPGGPKLKKDRIPFVLERTFKGTEHLDDGMLMELERNGLQIRWMPKSVKSDNRAFFLGRNFSVNFYDGAGRDLNTVAHEVGHSWDHWLNGKGSHRGRGSGKKWAKNMYVTPKDTTQYRKWYDKPKTGAKGTYSNNDGKYWKGNWIDDYEGRIYDKYGGVTVAEEYFSMGTERYAAYWRRLNDPKMWDDLSEAEQWLEMSTAQSKLMQRYRWTDNVKYEKYKKLQKEYRQNSINWMGTDDGSPRPKLPKGAKEDVAALNSDWYRQKAHYPEYADWMDEHYQKDWDYTLDPHWKDIEAGEAKFYTSKNAISVEKANAGVVEARVLDLTDQTKYGTNFHKDEWRAQAFWDSLEDGQGYKFKERGSLKIGFKGNTYRELRMSTSIQQGRPKVKAILNADYNGMNVHVYKNGDLWIENFAYSTHEEGEAMLQTVLSQLPEGGQLHIPKRVYNNKGNWNSVKFWDTMQEKYPKHRLWADEIPYEFADEVRAIDPLPIKRTRLGEKVKPVKPPSVKPEALKFVEGNTLEEVQKSLTDFGFGDVRLGGYTGNPKQVVEQLNVIGKDMEDMYKRFPRMREYVTKQPYLEFQNVKTIDGNRAHWGSGYIKMGTKGTRVKPNLSIGKNVRFVATDGASDFRHEYGHFFMDENPKMYAEFKDEFFGRVKREGISQYAGEAVNEAFSEAFSAYTSPLYGQSKARRLPGDVEAFFDRWLKTPKKGGTLAPRSRRLTVITKRADVPKLTKKTAKEIGQTDVDKVLKYVETEVSEDWNHHLRMGAKEKAPWPGNTLQEHKELLELIDRLPSYKGTSYRGLQFPTNNDAENFMKQFKQGGRYVDKGWTSSTLSKRVASDYSLDFDNPVVIKIKGKTGRPVSNFSKTKMYIDEEEILFKPDTNFRIKKKFKNKDGVWEMHIEELDEPKRVKAATQRMDAGPTKPRKMPIRSEGNYKRVDNNWYRDGEQVDAATKKRLNDLKLPPSWEDVRVDVDPNAKLVAAGVDKAGRVQPRYSKEWVKESAMKKFHRVRFFNDDIEKLRTGIAGKDDIYSKLLRLEDKTAIRMGNPKDIGAKKKAYGITTLERQHVKVEGDKIILDFTAKEGLPAHYEIVDPELAQFFTERMKVTKSGQRLWPEVNPQKLNAYIKELAGKDYSIKDFRTYHGTRIAYENLKNYAGRTLDKIQKKNVVLEVTKAASEFLHNTPVMAKNSYIDPIVWEMIGGI